MVDKEAGEVADFYTSVFKDSKIKASTTLHNTPSGNTDIVTVDLLGQEFTLINAFQIQSICVILDKAVQFLEKNTGLRRTDRGSRCVIFGEMYRDYIMVSLSQEDDTFEVTVESMEHEYLAQKFVEKLKQ